MMVAKYLSKRPGPDIKWIKQILMSTDRSTGRSQTRAGLGFDSPEWEVRCLGDELCS